MTDSPLPSAARRAGAVFAWALGALLIGAVVVTAWVAVRGVLAYGHLRDAQSAAAHVRAEIADPATASSAIAGISSHTAAARALTSDPLWQLAQGTPWVGPQLSAVSAVAASIDDVVGTALTPLAHVAASFSVDGLKPQNGRIDPAAFAEIADAANTTANGIAAAAASVAAIDRTPLVAPVRDAVDEVEALLGETRTATDALANATVLLPAMLGAEGPRDYLVLFQNNAEWRSLGGIPGAIALLHTDDGTLSLTAQESSADYPRYDASVLDLGEEVEAIYGQRPGRWLQNVTQVPDFATSAALAREMWAREHGGQQVDGVVAVDPVALSYLLEATGPVALPSGDVLTAESAVPLLLNEVYKRFPRPADQDAFFATAAAAVFDALTRGDVDPTSLVEALTRAGQENRLLLWSAHEEDQEVLADTTLAGGLPASDAAASRFGVYLNDGTGSKMDFYQTASAAVAWTSCSIAGSGRASGDAAVTVTVTNTAPADAATLPSYITGGGAYGVPAGTARTVGYVYLPEGFELIDAAMSDGSGFGGGMHEGRRVLSFSIDLAPGQTATATITARTVSSAPALEVRSTPTIAGTGPVAALCDGS